MNNVKNDLKVLSYLNDILEGLEYLHQLSFVHSDIRIEKLFCSSQKGFELREVKKKIKNKRNLFVG